MSINISIDNTLVNDQTADVQTPLTTNDTGNDSNLDFADPTPGSNPLDGTISGAAYSAAFLSFLNGSSIFGSTTLALTDAQKAFAANVDGAVSSSSFVTVTPTASETINDLYFSDASGAALNGQQVFSNGVAMQTLGGDNVYLWSNGDYAIAATRDPITHNAVRVVAAFYLNEAANHLTAQVQMVTFEALSHPITTNPDDSLNFSDVLQVSAAGSLSFNFDNLPSGSFLYAAVGNSGAALLVTGQDLNVNDTAGAKLGNLVTGGSDPSDTVNTSQGGIGATIGINSQHFTDSGSGGSRVDGAVGVFTLVRGFGSFDATVNGTSEGTGSNVNEITYNDYVNAPSAAIFISQSTGASSIGGAIRVTLWEAGGGALVDGSGNPLPAPDHAPGDLKPEVGYADTANTFSYIGNQDTDSHLRDDTRVLVGSVTISRGANNYVFTGSGGTQSGITVAISSNGFTVTGLMTSDTVGFAAANDPNNALDGTFNRFDVQSLANSNPVDIGRIDLAQGVSISHGIGSDLIVQDDGPSITATITGAPTPTVDESNFTIDGTGSFAAQFSPAYGTDGQAATPVTYALSTPGGASGLTDTLTGQSVVLSLNTTTHQIEGHTATSNDLVFLVSVSAAGVVTLDQQRAVVHSNTSDSNDSRSLTSADLVVLTATAHDGDGDSASAPLNIGTQLIFYDDGPSITVNSTTPSPITDDETLLGTDNFANYATSFTSSYGADGQAGTPVTYGISATASADSGLIESGSGNTVFLFNEGGVVVGRAGTTALTAVNGDIVFTVTIDSTGKVTLDQRLGVGHTPNVTANDVSTLSSSGLVVVTATAHDGDGDTASTGLNIGTLLNFQDDAPTITSQISGGTVDDATGATGTVTHSLNGAIGADVGSATQQSLSGVKEYTITSWDTPTGVYPNLTGVLSADHTTLTYYSTSDPSQENTSTAVYQLALNQTANSGAGSYTFTVLQPPPIVQTNFNFTDLPSGQNLFGIIATDKADLTKGGLLVFPSDPVLGADGTYTNISGTINTSKGGGPVTIGDANQAFDHAGEGAYFMYVDNPTSAGVGGLGLTATNADDADTIRFNGVNEATRASVSIVQASGKGTVASPGPALHIFAYEANPGNVSTDTAARAEVNNPTIAAANQGTDAAKVDIIGIKIHDSTGAVIEYRTVDQAAGGANPGTLHGPDSLVGINFILDDPKGAGTADDIYSAVITNLRAGYTVEFITATTHDLALVQNVSGSYDIGGFNVFNQANVPAEDFHFSVQINDYDNDVFGGPSIAFATFAVHVNDLVFL
jgi:hypothetical protein